MNAHVGPSAVLVCLCVGLGLSETTEPGVALVDDELVGVEYETLSSAPGCLPGGFQVAAARYGRAVAGPMVERELPRSGRWLRARATELLGFVSALEVSEADSSRRVRL